MILWLAEKIVDRFFSFFPQKMPDNAAANKACLIAHRGAHDKKLGIVENTDAAFARALALGCFGIEFDVHATADGVLVVNHDPTLKRLWHQKGVISAMTFKALRELVPQIPSLAEVVERYGQRLHFFIELKAPFNAEGALKEALKSLVPGKDYHLLSLDIPIFESFTRFPLDAMLLVPVHNNVRQFCKSVMRNKLGGVLGHFLLLNDAKIKALRNAEKVVGVGMVNSRLGLYRELNRGVFWVFSDNVGLLSDCLRKLQLCRVGKAKRAHQ
jgi:glycerophosphoryl diester phosphodiesterase